MDINTQFLFLFSGLGAINGLILSIYFLAFARPKHPSNYFLGGLLFALSTRIGKSVFLFFNRDLAKIYLQIGLSACFFIGPFLYLYITSTQSPEKSKRIARLLLPALLLLVLAGGLIYPYQGVPEIWRVFYKIINYQWLLFIVLAGYEMRKSWNKLFIAREKLTYQEVWSLSVFLGVLAIWTAYYTSFYTSYIVGALSFSFVLYASIFVLTSFRGKKEITPAPREKYANKKIGEAEARKWLSQIDRLMQEEEAYKDPDLSLSKLAQKLHLSPHLLSQFLNDNLNKRFSHFINEYRIEAAKQMLVTEPHLKMEVIAEQCGFNSTSTFYNAFKKFTQTTPARYMAER